MDIRIDFESHHENKLSDIEVANSLLAKFQPILTSIGKRRKKIKSLDMLYDVPSVLLYDQVKDLYCLGYFVSAIIVCRSAAEHLAFEIFFEEVDLEGNIEIIESIAESLNFRKIVNEFLYNPKKNYKIVDENARDLFNKLYDVGNNWVHPKKILRGIRIEDEAFKSLEMLGSLLYELRNVRKDYDIFKGGLVKKTTARKKIRPLVLGSNSK